MTYEDPWAQVRLSETLGFMCGSLFARSNISLNARNKKVDSSRVVRCRLWVVLLMRYLGIVWGPRYPREQVGALRPAAFSPAAYLANNPRRVAEA